MRLISASSEQPTSKLSRKHSFRNSSSKDTYGSTGSKASAVSQVLHEEQEEEEIKAEDLNFVSPKSGVYRPSSKKGGKNRKQSCVVM